MLKYSFIIPVKEINNYVREAVPKILEIGREDFEIILYVDIANSETWLKTRQIATGPGGPAMKRSLAARDAQGEILVFIDDDAYPKKDFLEKLDEAFKNENVVAVGGPAITPANNNFWQKVSGAVFLSKLSGGFPERYAPVGSKKFIDDWPSVNLSVRKDAFAKVGGFKSSFWPGEDTLFCEELVKETGKNILYDPAVIVFHHRREGFFRHLKQVGAYGLHRGFFAKKFGGASLKLKYFLPSLFLLFIVLGAGLSFVSFLLFKLYIAGWAIYLLALLKALLDIKQYEASWLVALHSLYYIVATHIVYGWHFLRGLFKKELVSKLR
ncbi:MAG: glycosyltransferase [Candidatus Falkowbacteria bacterium]